MLSIEMRFYLAGGFEILKNPESEEAFARMMLRRHEIYRRLVSFYYPQHLKAVLPLKQKEDISGRIKIMVDSGAYSAKKEGDVDIDAYIEFLEEKEDVIDHYINLDLMGNGEVSFRNYRYMKQKGRNPIPVYHSSTPIKYLKHYIQNTDYIALSVEGRINSKKTIQQLDYLWRRHLTDSEGHPLVKVHLLGRSPSPILNEYPFYSADSTSWVKNSAFGSVVVPRKKDGRYIYNETSDIVPVSRRRLHDEKHLSNRKLVERERIISYLEEKMIGLGI